jgi:hypothetical protein
MMAKSGGSIATDMMQPGPGHDGLPDWGPAEGVVSFTGRALLYRKKPQGVLAVFSRRKLPDSTNNWLRLFANQAAVAIGNARAFEEIEYLKARLEEENHYLREEVTSALGVGDIIGNSPGSEEGAGADPVRRADGRRCACHRREWHRARNSSPAPSTRVARAGIAR